MLSSQQVSEIALAVVEQHLPRMNERLSVARIIDSSGEDAWRIEAVMRQDALERSLANARAEALTELQWKLGQAGEQRFAYLAFTSDAELAETAALSGDG